MDENKQSADVTAGAVLETARKTAADLLIKTQEQNTIALTNALRQVFGENTESQRFVDVTRIPLICKSIVDMHENIKEIKNKLNDDFITKDQFSPVRTLVYGAVGMVLVSVFGALIALVIIKR